MNFITIKAERNQWGCGFVVSILGGWFSTWHSPGWGSTCIARFYVDFPLSKAAYGKISTAGGAE